MEGKVVELRDGSEYLVVVSKRGFKLLDMKTFTLSVLSFADDQELLANLDIASIRTYRGEK